MTDTFITVVFVNDVEANSRRRQVHEYLVTSFVLSCLWLLFDRKEENI